LVACLACVPSALAAEAQTITFTSKAPTAATVGGAKYTVKATGGASGNPVTFTIDAASTSVCTISGATVSFIGAGTCTIDANQAGNAEFEPAPQAQQSFAVGKGSQTIAFTSQAPTSATVGGPSYTVAATGGGSGNAVTFTIDAASTSVCTISGATVSFIGAGTCTIDANQAGNAEFEPAPQAQQSFVVGKGSQTITFTSKPPNPGAVGGVYTAEAKASSQLPVSFSSATPSVCTVSGATVTLRAAGTCKIEASQSGNGSWSAAPAQAQEFSVVSRSQTVSFTSAPPSGATVGGSYTVSATTSSGLPVSFTTATPSVCAISGQIVSLLAPGTCTIVASQSGSNEYGEAQAQQSFAVLAPPGKPSTPPPANTSRVTTVVVVPDSTFKVLGATLNLRNFWITFTETVHDPGTFTWVLTFKNGPFGVFGVGTASRKGCRAGHVKLKGRCRPSRIRFAEGSQYVPAPGNANFTVVPTPAGMKALKTAFKRKASLPVRAVVIFQSQKGGPSVTHIQKLVVKLRK
jgi:hypothetical protein